MSTGKQAELVFRSWGGRRRGAGRKPAAGRRSVTHRCRPVHDGRLPVHVTVRLRRVPDHPRPAAYAVNGRRADRRIALPSYALSFADGAREVPVEDPMRLLVGRFAADLAAGREDEPDDDTLTERMRLLAEIVGAFRAGV